MSEGRQLVKKICMIGDPAVGKTSLIRKFVFNMFDDVYLHTIGTKITKKVVNYEEENTKMTMVIWDIMGQRYQRVLDSYFVGAKGAIAVCDVTRSETLDHLPDWLLSMNKISGKIPIVILANKVDLEDKKLFGDQEVKFLANKYSGTHFMTSAKTGQGVEEAFHALGKMMMQKTA